MNRSIPTTLDHPHTPLPTGTAPPASAEIDQATIDLQAKALNHSSQKKVEHSSSGPFELWWAEYGRPSAILQEQVRYLIDFYRIDPWLGDIKIHHQSGQWLPYITMDGWMKMINQHPAFCGIDFRESDQLIEGAPEWMSCTIYRHDRVIPITVREYYKEVKQENPLWNGIPRRLLRFRTMQQCARLALGLSTPEFVHQHHEATQTCSPSSSKGKASSQLEQIKGCLIPSQNQSFLKVSDKYPS